MAMIKAKEAFEKINQGIQLLLEKDEWKKFLQARKHFHSYSFGNVLLIFAQCPHATQVAGFKTWQKLGRYVKKGEKGIQILAPVIKVEKVEEEETNEDLAVSTDAETAKEKERRTLIGFRVVYVFDVSQTDGAPLPPHPKVSLVEGNTNGLYEKALRACPFPVQEKDCKGASGYFERTTQSIAIQKGLPERHKLKTLIHEWSHGLLHGEWTDSTPHVLRELEAESTAFIVMDALGMDTSGYSFAYLASWGNGEDAIQMIRQSGPRIFQTAEIIQNALLPESTKTRTAAVGE